MVHAQINCPRFLPQAHTATTVANFGDAYQRRPTLDRRAAGDVYAAMSCFGLCVASIGGKTATQAIADMANLAQVTREVVRNCSVAFDHDRDAELYSGLEAVKGIVDPGTGIIKAMHTGSGAHFMETRPDPALSPEQRLEEALARATQAYAGGARDVFGVILPGTLDDQDRIYIVDQGHVGVPVLQYNGEICIDFTEGAIISGVTVVTDGGLPRHCVTRDLYSLPNITEIMVPPGGGVVFTRRVEVPESGAAPGIHEPAVSNLNTSYSLERIHDWLTLVHDDLNAYSNFDYRHRPYDLRANPIVHEMKYGRGRNIPAELSCARGGGDRSMLGVPLPQMIDEVGNVKVAPLVYAPGVEHTATVGDERAGVDMDELVARVSRTGARNVIGVAMQKIEPNCQGDLMLHDGV